MSGFAKLSLTCELYIDFNKAIKKSHFSEALVMNDIIPLKLSEDMLENYNKYFERSKLESLLLFFPIVGWVIASRLLKKRIRHVVDYINAQLTERPSIKLEEFYYDDLKKEVAWFLREIIFETIGWKSDKFIPEDPIDIIMWSHYDDLDEAMVIVAIEYAIGRSLLESELTSISKGTLGDLVEFVAPEKIDEHLTL